MLSDQNDTPETGIISRHQDGYSVRFERHLSHPLDKVWEAITRPEHLAKWLAIVNIDPVPGGKMILAFTNSPSTSVGKITRIDPPTLLEYTWQENNDAPSLVCWELQPEGPAGCLLVLTHTLLNKEVPSFGAGWHTHLDLLTEVLSSSRVAFSWEDEWWESKLPVYEAAIRQGTGSYPCPPQG